MSNITFRYAASAFIWFRLQLQDFHDCRLVSWWNTLSFHMPLNRQFNHLLFNITCVIEKSRNKWYACIGNRHSENSSKSSENKVQTFILWQWTNEHWQEISQMVHSEWAQFTFPLNTHYVILKMSLSTQLVSPALTNEHAKCKDCLRGTY